MQNFEDFKKPNFDELYNSYKNMETRTPQEESYFKFLEYSKNNGDVSKFYFTFPYFKGGDPHAELHHYTFPWVREVVSHEKRIVVIHHLIRSWFKFAEQAGIISWFNYGNAIGWYFNGLNLPWDNDVDVQVSISDLDKIGRSHNNTLIVEDPNLGSNLFWLHTDPYYLRENINQFIDARYIDIITGLYIDISAVWYDDTKPPQNIKLKEGEVAIRCKHKNWFSFSDIFPIKRTIFEGAQAYMVRDVEDCILKSYGKRPITVMNFQHHNWQADIGLWVPNEVCENAAVPKTKDRFTEDGELTFYGACNNTDLLNYYYQLKPAIDLKRKEAELIKAGKKHKRVYKRITSNIKVLQLR